MPAPRRTLPLLGLGVVLALSVAGCTVDASAPEAPASAAAADSPEYLWALSAADGSLVGTDDEHLYLHLTGVGEAVTRFSDRPDRLASAVDLSDFLGRWDGRFSDDPPNAVLSYQPDGAGVQQQIVVTLSRPRWDDATRSLVFAADRIRKEADDLAGTEHPLDPALIDNPVGTGPVAVFVDGAGDVGANGTVGELAADGSAQVLEALEQMRANGFSERTTTMANDVSRLHLLLGELLIARDGLARAISAGAAPAADVSAVLGEAGIRVSSPPTQADATALDAKIDEIRDTIGLDSSRLQELVEQEDQALEAQAAIVEKLREAASSLLDRTGL
jgi:hypothetical protein